MRSSFAPFLLYLPFPLGLDLDFAMQNSEELAKGLSTSTATIGLFFLSKDLECLLQLFVGRSELGM
jgi:hypothetical protein